MYHAKKTRRIVKRRPAGMHGRHTSLCEMTTFQTEARALDVCPCLGAYSHLDDNLKSLYITLFISTSTSPLVIVNARPAWTFRFRDFLSRASACVVRAIDVSRVRQRRICRRVEWKYSQGGGQWWIARSTLYMLYPVAHRYSTRQH